MSRLPIAPGRPSAPAPLSICYNREQQCYLVVSGLKLLVVKHHNLDFADGVLNRVLLYVTRNEITNARQVGSGNQTRIVQIHLCVVIPTRSHSLLRVSQPI